MSYLARYLLGAHREVWDELIAFGGDVREQLLRDDAEAVVRETMLRVRQNVITLIAGLRAHGFQFGVYPDGEPLASVAPLLDPKPDFDRHLHTLESRLATVPLSLAGFWRYVGEVNLTGMHDDFPLDIMTDPLWVESVDLNAGISVPFGACDLRVIIAPDVYHKDNVSGGPPYEIAVPNASIDGVLLSEGHDWMFVEYLRQAFDWGGFPGFEQSPEAMPEWLDELSERMIRF